MAQPRLCPFHRCEMREYIDTRQWEPVSHWWCPECDRGSEEGYQFAGGVLFCLALLAVVAFVWWINR